MNSKIHKQNHNTYDHGKGYLDNDDPNDNKKDEASHDLRSIYRLWE